MSDIIVDPLLNKCRAIEAAILDKNYPAARDLTLDLFNDVSVRYISEWEIRKNKEKISVVIE